MNNSAQFLNVEGVRGGQNILDENEDIVDLSINIDPD